ncbi:hypothetical protein GCM10022419_114100 [Nonomuraea rosea]|uniref:Uncharacterized protein n=1 Tax=Nonomuraea rosea TaxID=638574 RepID=A0ABP6ZLX7_9ACTN
MDSRHRMLRLSGDERPLPHTEIGNRLDLSCGSLGRLLTDPHTPLSHGLEVVMASPTTPTAPL